jgi:hypothetical protein
MNALPSDLVPLPTAPYPERPVSLPLDTEECRTAIWLVRGNITEAAKILKVTSNRLRTFVTKSPYLSAEMQEAKDQLVDIAEDVVYDALTDDEDKGRKDTMARFVLTNLGRSRGYGVSSSVNIKNTGGGTIIVQWADGTNFGVSPGAEDGDPPRNGHPEEGLLIDATPNEAA